MIALASNIAVVACEAEDGGESARLAFASHYPDLLGVLA